MSTSNNGPDNGFWSFSPALDHSNFRRYYFGQLFSLVGTWIQITALSWLVWELTGEKDKLGAVDFASRIPSLFLPLVAGVLADQYSRYKLVLITQSLALAQAAALAALAMSGHITVAWIIPLSIFLGIITAFDMPIRQSFFIELVKRPALPNAVALNGFAFNAARVVGPALAGWLLIFITPGICFLINAISYLVVLGALLWIKPNPRPAEQYHRNPLKNLAEAVRFIHTHVALRDLLLYLGVTSFAALPYHSMLPAIADENLGANEAGFGKMLSAIGIGAICGSSMLASTRINRNLDRAVPVAGICFGLGLLAFTFSSNLNLSLLILIPVGTFMMVHTLSTNMFIQKHVPDRLRGRIMSIYSVMLLGLWPIGSLLVGALAERYQTYPILRVGAAVVILGGIIICMRNRAIRASAAILIDEEDERERTSALLLEQIAGD